MKLLFYSGGDYSENIELNQMALSTIKNKKIQITYIPASSFGHREDYQKFVSAFKKEGVKRFLYFPIETKVSLPLQREVFKSDIIFLSGGNTYLFLQSLVFHNLVKPLVDFVNRGGILMGLSAGAIILTPNIKTASFPSFDCDENFIRLKKQSGLSLVKFEYFPHYKNSHRYDQEIMKRSSCIKHPIYASPDGSGIFINGSMMTFIGKTFCFYQNHKFTVVS